MLKKGSFKIKKLLKSSSLVISMFALLLSAISIYFQFFVTKHSVLYSTLDPEFKMDNNEVVIPLLFKNTGNQTEVILNTDLQLEIKREDRNAFKQISTKEKIDSYIVLAPKEHKTVYLTGNLINHFDSLKINYYKKTDSNYIPTTIFENLLLKVQINYLTTSGKMAREDREIGELTFDPNENICLLNCYPIELIKLNLKSRDSKILFQFITHNYNDDKNSSYNLNDSLSDKQNKDTSQLIDKTVKRYLEKYLKE